MKILSISAKPTAAADKFTYGVKITESGILTPISFPLYINRSFRPFRSFRSLNVHNELFELSLYTNKNTQVFQKNMISEQLRKKLEARFGKAIRYSQECEALSESIYEETSERLSTTTLKRLLGITTMRVAPRASTLDILAEYIGETESEDNIISSFAQADDIHSDDLSDGTRLRICYHPERTIEMKYLGNHLFYIEKAVGCKLCKGDMIKVDCFRKGFELIAWQVIRDGVNMGLYFAAKDIGLSSIEIIG